jgi:hypothetical protein
MSDGPESAKRMNEYRSATTIVVSRPIRRTRWHIHALHGIVDDMSTPENEREGTQGEYSLDDEDQLQPEDTLDDHGVEDVLDEGYSPPDHPQGIDTYGITDAEQRAGESVDQKLAEERPDPAQEIQLGAEEGTEIGADPVGAPRAGQLVAADEGVNEDTEKDLTARDEGISGGAASAEEEAVRVVEED